MQGSAPTCVCSRTLSQGSPPTLARICTSRSGGQAAPASARQLLCTRRSLTTQLPPQVPQYCASDTLAFVFLVSVDIRLACCSSIPPMSCVSSPPPRMSMSLPHGTLSFSQVPVSGRQRTVPHQRTSLRHSDPEKPFRMPAARSCAISSYRDNVSIIVSNQASLPSDP